MKLKTISDNIYHVQGKNQYEATSTLMRLQEFYESSLRGIRGRYFSLEQYMDAYAKRHGNFTYCVDWTGFNVPGNIVRKFFNVFIDDLLEKEERLYQLLEDPIESNKKFYLIGSYKDKIEDDVIDHELAHALFYLNFDYKKTMNNITKSLPASTRSKMFQSLEEDGYCKKVLTDELQAYCSTSTMVELTDQFENVDVPWNDVLEYKKTFSQYKNELFE